MNLWTTTYIEKFKKTPYLQHNEKELHITVKKDIFVPMEPVEIIVSMRNTALETRKFMPSGWLSYTGHCMKGEKMPQPIKEINGLPLSPLFANPTCFAEPNQIFWNNTSTLNKKNDITLEGEYHIQMFHLDCYNFINHSAQIKQKDNNELPKNTSTFQSIDQKFKVEWIKSNIITIKVDSTLIDLSKVISPDLQRTYTKPSHGVSFSFVSDKLRYDNYGPVYFRIATKNVSSESVSMIVDTKNVLDVYELVLLTPGDNLDFRKPARQDKSDVQKVAHTLYGEKLVSDKSKTPKPLVSVKPNEETAESVFVLNRIFDMSTDGIYGLIVTRKIIDAAGKEQTISSDPFPIRIGQSSTQDEINERIQQRRLEGNDPDYPIWQSQDGLFKVIAKLISIDKDIVTLEKIDGKRTTFNISNLSKINQDYIKEQKQKNNNLSLEGTK